MFASFFGPSILPSLFSQLALIAIDYSFIISAGFSQSPWKFIRKRRQTSVGSPKSRGREPEGQAFAFRIGRSSHFQRFSTTFSESVKDFPGLPSSEASSLSSLPLTCSIPSSYPLVPSVGPVLASPPFPSSRLGSPRSGLTHHTYNASSTSFFSSESFLRDVFLADKRSLPSSFSLAMVQSFLYRLLPFPPVPLPLFFPLPCPHTHLSHSAN